MPTGDPQAPAPLLGPTRATSHLLSCLDMQRVVEGREGLRKGVEGRGELGCEIKPSRRKL